MCRRTKEQSQDLFQRHLKITSTKNTIFCKGKRKGLKKKCLKENKLRTDARPDIIQILSEWSNLLMTDLSNRIKSLKKKVNLFWEKKTLQ